MKDQPEELQTVGAMILGLRFACVNLNYYIDDDMKTFLDGVDPNEWYPVQRFNDLLHIVTSRYVDPVPIMERIGAEMARFYFEFGPAEHLFTKGTDFLRIQSSSTGYYSVMRGPEELIGRFDLVELDEHAGHATIYSTTPYSKDLERGMIQGGMTLKGDLLYVHADNSADPHTIHVEFH